VASTVIVLLLIAATYDRLPWRPLPPEEPKSDAADQDPLPTGRTPQPASLPGAYAESS
jgi:alpha-1,6-mannosyltransferase